MYQFGAVVSHVSPGAINLEPLERFSRLYLEQHHLFCPLLGCVRGLKRLYNNQLALEAAILELMLVVEQQGHADACENVRGALRAIGENKGHIRQGLAKLVLQHRKDD